MSTHKHHGMLFADRLMPPLLDGRKTQTRRPINPQPEWKERQPNSLAAPGWSWSRKKPGAYLSSWIDDESFAAALAEFSPWQIGDLIWARETFQPEIAHSCAPGACDCDDVNVRYPATDDWRHFYGGDIPDEWVFPKNYRRGNSIPSIHMPKWACRCWKEITGVRAERVLDISEEDALAEGIKCLNGRYTWNGGLAELRTARDAFHNAWDTIYRGSLERNDWVWVIEFKPTEAPLF